MEILLYAALAYIAFQHLVAPVIVWRLSKLPCTYTFPPVGWRDAVTNAGAPFLAAHNELQGTGFHPVAASGMGLSHSSSFFVMYRSKTDSAIVTLMRSVNSVGEYVSIDITQPYGDDVHLSLTNAALPLIYPPWDKKCVYRLPATMAFGELWTRFRILRDRSGLAGQATVSEGEELALVEKFSNAEIRHLCDTGFMEAACVDGVRRLSLKGAYTASWKLLWPWKWLITRAAHASALRQSTT